MPKFDLGLPGYNSLFSTEEERTSQSTDLNTDHVEMIPIEAIQDFKDHPFHVGMDDDMVKLIDSIQENGLLMPVMVRPLKDGQGYEMIAGHRRKYALQKLGLDKVQAIIKNINDDEATILMVDSNIQREYISPTEKAHAYKIRLDAMKHQGRNLLVDTTCAQVGYKSKNKRSIEVLSELVGESRNQVQRFIRLTFLIEPFQQMVDGRYEEKRYVMAFNPAVELSFLKEQEQLDLLDVIKELDATPSLMQAQKFKQASRDGSLDISYMRGVLSIEKPNQKEPKPVNWNKYNKYFPKTYTQEQKDKIVENLLSTWAKKREKDAIR